MWVPIAFGFRGREAAKWTALPCLAFWLFVMPLGCNTVHLAVSSVVCQPVGQAILPNATWFLEDGNSAEVVGRAPRPARDALVPLSEQQHQHLAGSGRPTGASAADQGVRPTIYAECAVLGKLCGIRRGALWAGLSATEGLSEQYWG